MPLTTNPRNAPKRNVTTTNITDMTTEMVNLYIEKRARDICSDLNIEFKPSYLKKLDVKTVKESGKDNKHPDRCKARVKNDGWGRQCSRSAADDCDFCATHNKPTKTGTLKWEELGRIDTVAPQKFIQWYKKKGYEIKNPNRFYDLNNVSLLTDDERSEFHKCL